MDKLNNASVIFAVAHERHISFMRIFGLLRPGLTYPIILQ